MVKCPAIAPPSRGLLVPSSCMSASGVYYKTQCLLWCNDTAGYRLEGARNVSCLESGLWSANISETVCRGREKQLRYIFRIILFGKYFSALGCKEMLSVTKKMIWWIYYNKSPFVNFAWKKMIHEWKTIIQVYLTSTLQTFDDLQIYSHPAFAVQVPWRSPPKLVSHMLGWLGTYRFQLTTPKSSQFWAV